MNFSMRKSRTLRKLRAGGIVNCFKMNFSDIRAFEIAARHGFDVLWTDMEHVANDWSVIEKQVLATKAYDVDLLCRVARGSYSDYIRPLEMDASGIMVPHVMNAAEAEQVVSMTKYKPVGNRAVDGGNADGGFCNVPFLEYLKTANSEHFTILQIEDPEAVDDLEAIAAVPGYEMLFFGRQDLSCALGVPGQNDHPEVQRARKLVAKMAQKYGKFAGAAGPAAGRQELIDLGYTFISTGADVVGLGNYCKEIASAVGISASNEPASNIR
jgi:4-hydroxy-2-oxoheptanedioate aldolase